MADYSIIKSLIQQVVKTNGEQEITGANLQNVLVSMINAVASSNNEDFDRINGNILNLLNYVDTENEDIRNEMQELANRLDTNRFGYNVSVFGLVAGVHTLSTAVKNVPPAERFGGQKITFKTDAGWVTYQNISLSIDNYEDVNNWVLDSGVNVEGDVTITNNPDYEDLTQNSQNELKFADKEYNADTFSGLGRVYLRKNIVSNKNVLTQAMLADENTIYIIQYDYVLGEDITVPENCVLEFDGGSISASDSYDTITGSDTRINAGLIKIFNINLDIRGTWLITCLYPQWFGAVSDYDESSSEGTDSTIYFQKCMDVMEVFRGCPIKVVGQFLIGGKVDCVYDFALVGTHTNTRTLLNIQEALPSSNSLIAIDDGVSAFNIVGRSDNDQSIHANRFFMTFSVKNIKFVGVNRDTTTAFDIKMEGCPARPCIIDECEFTNLNKVIFSNPAGLNSSGTTIGVFSITNCNAYFLNKFIDSNNVNTPTFTNLILRDNVIEQNSPYVISLKHAYGTLTIENNIFENEGTPLYITCNSHCNILITENYFEQITSQIIEHGSRVIDIEGLNNGVDYPKAVTILSMFGNHYSDGNSNLSIRLKNIRICSIDAFMYYPGDSIIEGCILESSCDYHIPIQSFYGCNLLKRHINTANACSNPTQLRYSLNTPKCAIKEGLLGFSCTTTLSSSSASDYYPIQSEYAYIGFFKEVGKGVFQATYQNTGGVAESINILQESGFCIVTCTVPSGATGLSAKITNINEGFVSFPYNLTGYVDEIKLPINVLPNKSVDIYSFNIKDNIIPLIWSEKFNSLFYYNNNVYIDGNDKHIDRTYTNEMVFTEGKATNLITEAGDTGYNIYFNAVAGMDYIMKSVHEGDIVKIIGSAGQSQRLYALVKNVVDLGGGLMSVDVISVADGAMSVTEYAPLYMKIPEDCTIIVQSYNDIEYSATIFTNYQSN